MKYLASSTAIKIVHGIGPKRERDAYFVHVEPVGEVGCIHQVEGAEAELLGLLLNGRKLKQFSTCTFNAEELFESE